jgi:transcriptional regulator with XRE-family HTH domain
MFTMSNVTFGMWLRDQREGKRLSQTELANIFGVRPGHISHLEAGDRGASTELLIQIADFFRVPLEDVVLMSVGRTPKSASEEDELIKKIKLEAEGLPREEKENVYEFTRHRRSVVEERTRSEATRKRRPHPANS